MGDAGAVADGRWRGHQPCRPRRAHRGAEDHDDLVGQVSREVRGLAEQRQNPLGDFKPRGALAGKEILDELGRANEIVAAKASAEEADAYRAFILECAQRAAEAAKEGGFMGFRAEQVSQGEQDMLEQLQSVLR